MRVEQVSLANIGRAMSGMVRLRPNGAGDSDLFPKPDPAGLLFFWLDQGE
jgi:hypothetical protein